MNKKWPQIHFFSFQCLQQTSGKIKQTEGNKKLWIFLLQRETTKNHFDCGKTFQRITAFIRRKATENCMRAHDETLFVFTNNFYCLCALFQHFSNVLYSPLNFDIKQKIISFFKPISFLFFFNNSIQRDGKLIAIIHSDKTKRRKQPRWW